MTRVVSLGQRPPPAHELRPCPSLSEAGQRLMAVRYYLNYISSNYNPAVGDRRRKGGTGPTILLVAGGTAITETRKWLFENAGYAVVLARTTEQALTVLESDARIDVLLLGAAIRSINVARVVEVTRGRKPKMFIVAASRTCRPGADFHIEPLAGPEALLRIVGEAIVTAHGHRFDDTDCVMFVDQNRRYIHVTDPAAQLVGYAREELLGMRIDDISAPEMEVSSKFASYIRDGSQHGWFNLRHRDGHLVRVRYHARVLEDGCMVSRLTKTSRPNQ